MYFPLEVTLIDLISGEECVRLVLECLHQPLCLKVRVEAHRWSDLFDFLAWPHLPDAPLGLLHRHSVDVTVLVLRRLHALIVGLDRAKTHPRRSQHLPLVLHLAETFPVVVSLSHGFGRHLREEKNREACYKNDGYNC